MTRSVYEKLRLLLDRHPIGCPPAPEIIEILKILFTKEEAKVALGLGFHPAPADEIAECVGINGEETKRRLESLAAKGMVFTRDKKGVRGYALSPIIALYERPYMKGIHTETLKKLTPLWKSYLPHAVEALGKSRTSITRVIPIEEKIEFTPDVLTFDKINEMIDKAHVVGIAHCACREMEQKCDAPREACMLFDATCTFLVERGFGRYLTKEEMRQKLRSFDEFGLIHQANNTRDRLTLICNCCSCCCSFLKAVASSSFIPVNDPEKCGGCGTCADQRCSMKAINMVDDKPVVAIERCIGCGLCASGCSNNALKMQKQFGIPEPPADFSEMADRILQNQGKADSL
ncbi:hypothetical protein ACFL9T_13495 [Thermodesulfobacteriota bacterium]